MRILCSFLLVVMAGAAAGCSHGATPAQGAAAVNGGHADPRNIADPPIGYVAGAGYRGFDRNEYPGDGMMKQMAGTFAFTGYWLTPPPGASVNQWKGKRELLEQQGWGFLLLANGRFEREILKAQKAGTAPEALGRKDAAAAVAAARAEGFRASSIVFLDQEEGGRLTPTQAAYLLAWTEAVASGGYRPGVYASGQMTSDAPGVFINTIRDIRDHVAKGHLHDVAIFDAQDTCPPAPGCTLQAKPLSAAGEPNLTAWQYSQTPRRPEITQSCAQTYGADNKCTAPRFPTVFLDMDVAATADPSETR